jgi:hypothetical protein
MTSTSISAGISGLWVRLRLFELAHPGGEVMIGLSMRFAFAMAGEEDQLSLPFTGQPL